MAVEYPKYVFLEHRLALVKTVNERRQLPKWGDMPKEGFEFNKDFHYQNLRDIPADLRVALREPDPEHEEPSTEPQPYDDSKAAKEAAREELIKKRAEALELRRQKANKAAAAKAELLQRRAASAAKKAAKKAAATQEA
jgi:hypothetical protein